MFVIIMFVQMPVYAYMQYACFVWLQNVYVRIHQKPTTNWHLAKHVWGLQVRKTSDKHDDIISPMQSLIKLAQGGAPPSYSSHVHHFIIEICRIITGSVRFTNENRVVATRRWLAAAESQSLQKSCILQPWIDP